MIDMEKPSQDIELHLGFRVTNIQHCNFNLDGDLIFSCTINTNDSQINVICVCSIQTKSNEMNCQKIFKIPEETKIVNVSR